jgi:hypothetical protein
MPDAVRGGRRVLGLRDGGRDSLHEHALVTRSPQRFNAEGIAVEQRSGNITSDSAQYAVPDPVDALKKRR